jgi:hypothetical protein
MRGLLGLLSWQFLAVSLSLLAGCAALPTPVVLDYGATHTVEGMSALFRAEATASRYTCSSSTAWGPLSLTLSKRSSGRSPTVWARSDSTTETGTAAAGML